MPAAVNPAQPDPEHDTAPPHVGRSAFIASLGSLNRVWVSFWGLLLLVGVVGFGILEPLRLHARRRPLASAAKLVLLGGFLLRLATMLASEGIDRYRVAAGL